MTSNFSIKTSKPGWRPTTSFWVTAAIWLLLLAMAFIPGGFAVWLVLFSLFLILTALYSLIFGRSSWLGLPHRKGAGGAVGAGFAVLIAGSVLVGTTAPEPGMSVPLADAQTSTASAATPSITRSSMPSATPSAKPSASPTAAPSERLVLLAGCFEDGESIKQGTEAVVCTLDDKGVLVWMSEKESTTLLETRAETKRVAEMQAETKRVAEAQAVADKAAEDEAARVAAQKVVDDTAWVAAQQAEADRVAAQRIADDAAWAAAQQAAADEAARLAAEQAAQQQVPPIQGFVDVPTSVYYANCDAVRAAGAAPLYAGQPGFQPKLDRNNNGVACE